MTLVEAMRCGVPVVSTDAPHGPGEILGDGEDGLLTPVGDPDAMADALLRLIDDDERRRSMAAAALANSARYDPAPIADRYEELFDDAVGQAAGPSAARGRGADRMPPLDGARPDPGGRVPCRRLRLGRRCAAAGRRRACGPVPDERTCTTC